MFLREGLLLKSPVSATVMPIILTGISPGLMQDYAKCKLCKICNILRVIVTVK